MPRTINDKIDALVVEGPDDGAVINALIKNLAGLDLAARPHRVVRTNDAGGGDAWAIATFKRLAETAQPDARIGLVVDRDQAANDKLPSVLEIVRRLDSGFRGILDGAGWIVNGRFGVWLWPDHQNHGDLEAFVTGLIPPSSTLTYAEAACRTAKDVHAAEFEHAHLGKAVLKTRSVWCDASAAGGYGHLIRNLPITPTPACAAFISWFAELFQDYPRSFGSE